MEFSLVLLVLTVLWKTSSCVLCYKCLPEDTGNNDRINTSCEHFDGSDRFVENCTKSTMCSKRVSTLTSVGKGSVSTVIVSRNCAKQSLGQEQRKSNGKWHQFTAIHEVHDEQCTQDDYDPDRLTVILNCHCRGDYCNASIVYGVHFKTILLLSILYVFQFS
ncbi:uncharacterized protein LOC112050006 [Bicyclus anynana]|uniref:Uncharacterized protein LOC112050006 n=1 Tax=Bicyclus anynana TaxID=110368 RepID=A0A6J1NAF2_BICAN|nr:uncharacterized protein LOC112050006 [Bicyclus anynana]